MILKLTLVQGKKIERQNAEKDKFEGWKDEIVELAKSAGLFVPTGYSFDKNITVEEQIDRFVQQINHYAAFNTNSWIFNELVKTNEGYVLQQYENINQWLDNIWMRDSRDGYNIHPTNIKVYDDFKDNGTWKYVNFSLTLSDDSERHFIVKSENGRWNLYPFNSAPEYNSLMDLVKSITVGQIPDENLKAIKRYVLSIQYGDTTIKMADDYNTIMSTETGEVYDAINVAVLNYLTKRLELNEC